MDFERDQVPSTTKEQRTNQLAHPVQGNSDSAGCCYANLAKQRLSLVDAGSFSAVSLERENCCILLIPSVFVASKGSIIADSLLEVSLLKSLNVFAFCKAC
jgi:hypothetical protein